VKVLVACEFSGVVRDAFGDRGHYAVSCDLLPSESPFGKHHVGDALGLLDQGWDLMIAHPPCTHLCSSGARWFAGKQSEQTAALDFVRALLAAPIGKIALENPVGVISSAVRKPDQIVQPWMFGDEATKTTCLWLKGLPQLAPDKIVGKGERHVTKGGRSLPKWYNLPPSPDRGKLRSLTFPGMARAMAEQWG
jgi:hypothetical protein